MQTWSICKCTQFSQISVPAPCENPPRANSRPVRIVGPREHFIYSSWEDFEPLLQLWIKASHLSKQNTVIVGDVRRMHPVRTCIQQKHLHAFHHNIKHCGYTVLIMPLIITEKGDNFHLLCISLVSSFITPWRLTTYKRVGKVWFVKGVPEKKYRLNRELNWINDLSTNIGRNDS